MDLSVDEMLRRQQSFQERMLDDGALGFNAAYSLASKNDGFRKCGKNVRYLRTDLDAFLASRTGTSTGAIKQMIAASHSRRA